MLWRMVAGMVATIEAVLMTATTDTGNAIRRTFCAGKLGGKHARRSFVLRRFCGPAGYRVVRSNKQTLRAREGSRGHLPSQR